MWFNEAIDYLNKGFSIIPIRQDKTPLVAWTKYKTERTDPDEIDEWLKKFPQANIAIVTGKISDIVVIDFDTPEALEIAKSKGLPVTPMVQTGRGFHAYFKYQDGVGNFQQRADLPGIDLRGDGGIVVAPPSKHENGTTYSWCPGQSLDDLPLADLPSWVLAKNVSEKTPLKELYNGVPKGERNDSLARVTGSWVRDGLTLDECIKMALAWNQQNIPPEENEQQFIATVESIYKKEALKNEIENGYKVSQKIDYSKVVELIKSEHTIAFAINTFYIYKEGYYQPLYELEIKQWIQKILKEKYSIHTANETIHFLKTDSFVSNENFVAGELDLNLKNGLYDYERNGLSNHHPGFYYVNQLPINYDPNAKCSLWFKTLDEIFEKVQWKIELLQEFFGLCLTPVTKYQKALFCIGESYTGKSTVMKVLEKMVGEKNKSSVPLEKFGDSHYLAKLKDKILNMTTESNASAQIYDSIFKAVVSGETIEADHKYDHPFSFQPFCKLVIATNNLPRIDDKTNAVYNRILPLRFNRIFTDKEQDRELDKKLELELDGIFLWAVEGLKRLQARGRFIETAEMKMEIDEYRKEQDNVIGFVSQRCQLKQECTIPKETLYTAYSDWTSKNGYIALGMIKFGRQLKERYRGKIIDKDTAGSRDWAGITLLPPS